MRDSCLQLPIQADRVALRLSPALAALLIQLAAPGCDGAIDIQLAAGRARDLREKLAGMRDGDGSQVEREALGGLILAIEDGLAAAAEQAPPRPRPKAGALTARELQILAELSRGASYAEIARDLVIDVETVRSHAKSIRRKLGVSRSSELAGWADTLLTL